MNMLKDTNKYEVINLGVSGRTMMKNGDYPYWKEKAYQTALNSHPDAVVLMLGTNDAKTYQWDVEQFKKDYLEMGNIFKNLDSKPDLHIMIPPPLYKDNAYRMNQTVINDVFPKLIPQLGKELGLA